jgi:hypothetical protein
LYVATLPNAIQTGEVYSITVTSGSTESKGSTTIPGKVSTNTHIQFDSILQYDDTYQYRVVMTTKLLEAGKHYLDFFPVLVYEDSTRDLMYAEGISTISELNQGQTVTKTFVSSFSSFGAAPIRVDLTVVNCDEGYGKSTLRILDLFGGINLSPFTDPGITYSNMTNGIGIIGSYNPETQYSFDLR